MNQEYKHRVAASIDEVLSKWWGYSEFRPMQREIIESILSGHDTLALMPTGGGKSLTFQVPALAVEGLTIVITPLIALMKDQVDNLRRRGISAVAVHSGLDQHRIEAALDNCAFGDVKLLYLSPERLATEAFRLRLRRMNVSFVVVDEAHCISQWGYDFRPSYLRIAEIRQMVPNATFLALTASATDVVARDIMKQLGFGEERILRTSFSRPNLSYVVRKTSDKLEQVKRVIEGVVGTGIIYADTRERCEELAKKLKDEGFKASFYHAGLPALERSMRQDEWRRDELDVIVATNAFGMGIDKSDVRFVIHYSLCDTLEAYYQEAGRAGRDGKRSYAVLLAEQRDGESIAKLFKTEFPPIADIKRVYELVCNYLQVAVGDGFGASFAFNIYDFCHTVKLSSIMVTNALKILEQNRLITLIDEQDNPAKLMFTCSRDSLYKLNAEGNDMDAMLLAILRLYNGVFTHFRNIDELQIASFSKLSPERVHELLKVLWRMHVIRYIPAQRTPMIYFDSERLPQKDIYIAPETYRYRYDKAVERFNSMLHYTTSTEECRSKIIEEYFGEPNAKDCGICDICIAKRKSGDSALVAENIDKQILSMLLEGDMAVKDIVAQISARKELIAQRIDYLLAEKKISVSISGKVKINK